MVLLNCYITIHVLMKEHVFMKNVLIYEKKHILMYELAQMVFIT